ncbi:MAG: GNAT family N-acetyltransferase [Pseudomonadota bacterium]
MIEIRPTTRTDIAAVDALLAASYPILLKPDYPPSVLVTALPLISRAQPALVTSGRYFGIFEADQLLGAGGWSAGAPGGAEGRQGIGHIRHVVVDHTRQRSGLGRALMDAILSDAKRAGISAMACQSTRTAEAFYQAMGFRSVRDIEVPLRAGIAFPAIAMVMDLAAGTPN